MTVNLNRNPAYTDHNIPLNESNFYRGVNLNGESWETMFDENGVMEGRGRGGSSNLSFQAGYPNDLYINGAQTMADTIIEANSTLSPDKIEERSGYAYKGRITRQQIEAGEIQLRIWRRKLDIADAAIRNTWTLEYSNMPNDDSPEVAY